MIKNVITSQTGGRPFVAPDLTKYSLFVGGANATHHALKNYSPLMNGFGRLFMVRPPLAIAKMFAGSDDIYTSDSLFMQFKHMMEYMNRSVTGFSNKTLEKASTAIEGGFAGRSFNTPTVTKETTNEFTVSLYELVGCPVYTVIDGWMNAIGDENSGLATYGGFISGGVDSNDIETRLYKTKNDTDYGIPFNEAYHTAEFIYVLHDRSGSQVERAVMLADCFPTGIDEGKLLNYEGSGNHDNVYYDITFNCVVYRSPIITAIANDLLKQYMVVSNSLNFNPELGDIVYNSEGNVDTGKLGETPIDTALTNVGNTPVYYSTNNIIDPTKSELRNISKSITSTANPKYDRGENAYSISKRGRRADYIFDQSEYINAR